MIKIAIKTIRIMGPDSATDDQNQAVGDNIDWGKIKYLIDKELPARYYAKVDDA